LPAKVTTYVREAAVSRWTCWSCRAADQQGCACASAGGRCACVVIVECPLGDDSESVGRLGRRADRHHSHLANDQADDQHQTKRDHRRKGSLSFHGNLRHVFRSAFKGNPPALRARCVALNLPLTLRRRVPCITQYALWNTHHGIRNTEQATRISYSVLRISYSVLRVSYSVLCGAPAVVRADPAHHHHPLAQDGAEAQRLVGLGGGAQVATAAELHVQRCRQRGQRIEHRLQRL